MVSGGGTIEQSTNATNLSGLATPGLWTLGAANPQQVMARAGNLEALFEATFCETADACDSIPANLAYVRDDAVWISGADGPVLVAKNASRPTWSVAVTEKVEGPEPVGVPEIVPVPGTSVSPAGSEPALTAYVGWPLPPVVRSVTA